MADFCLNCSQELFGPDAKSDFDFYKDFPKLESGYGYPALCEGCGITLVDNLGICISDCLKHHVPKEKVTFQKSDLDKEWL